MDRILDPFLWFQWIESISLFHIFEEIVLFRSSELDCVEWLRCAPDLKRLQRFRFSTQFHLAHVQSDGSDLDISIVDGKCRL